MLNLKSPLFECTMCAAKYTLADVKAGKYFPSTGICLKCYEQGKHSSFAVWCFGKTDVVKKKKVIRFGYNAQSQACKDECPDRHICRVFAAM